MSLVGAGDGGVYQALTSSWIGTSDFSVFFWIKLTGEPVRAARPIGMSQGLVRGFQIVCGTTNISGSTGRSITAAVGPNASTGWGNSANHGGLGCMNLNDALPDGEWVPVALVARGPSAGDSTASNGAHQIVSLHVGSTAGSYVVPSGGIPPTSTGSRAAFLGRDGGSNYFPGKLARVAVWVGYRLTEADREYLASGGNPMEVEPGSIVYYRPFVDSMDGVVWPGTLTTVGGGATLDASDNPPTGGGEGSTYNDTINEALGAADGYAASLTAAAVSPVETLTAGDSLSSSASYSAALAEVVALADLVASGNTYAVALSEAVTLSDVVAQAVVFAETLSEAATVADSITEQARHAAALGEIIALSEQLEVSGGADVAILGRRVTSVALPERSASTAVAEHWTAIALPRRWTSTVH